MKSPNLALMTLLLTLAAMVATSGCSSKREDEWTRGRPPVYPAKGQVLLDGEPVADATVTFQPVDDSGKAGFAVTDSGGFFTAQTFEPGDGLVEGTHRVAIQKVLLIDAQGNVVKEVHEPGGIQEKNFLPKNYAKFDKSGLEVEIVAGDENDLGKFELTK